MSKRNGLSFLLKISNGATPPTYSTVAGLRLTNMAINGECVEVPTIDQSGWRELLHGAGARSVTLDASGIFLGSTAESQVRGNALSGVIDAYQLSFEDGEKLCGRFLIKRLEFCGDWNGERRYSITLESSGEVTQP